MTDMTLNQETLRASKAAAALAAQVHRDLRETGQFAGEAGEIAAGQIAAAIIAGSFDAGCKPGVLVGRLVT